MLVSDFLGGAFVIGLDGAGLESKKLPLKDPQTESCSFRATSSMDDIVLLLTSLGSSLVVSATSSSLISSTLSMCF